MKLSSNVTISTAVMRELEKELCVKRGSLNGNEYLKDFKTWDSLAVIMLITTIDKKHHIIVDPIAIASASTVKDIINLVNAKIQS